MNANPQKKAPDQGAVITPDGLPDGHPPETSTPSPDAAAPSERSIKQRWGSELDEISRWRKNYTGLGGFVPIVRSFLRLYSQLSLSAAEAMLIIHILDSKWDNKAPRVKAPVLAARMGLKKQQLLRHVRNLKKKHQIGCEYEKKGDVYKFNFEAFFAALAAKARLRRDEAAKQRQDALDALNEGTW